MLPQPFGDPTVLVQHEGPGPKPPLIPFPVSWSRGGAYNEMLSHLGHHLEDLGGILVAHSVENGAASDLMVTPATPICGMRCMSPCGESAAGVAKSSSRTQATTPKATLSSISCQPKDLQAAQQQLRARLVAVNGQHQTRSLWDLAAGMKSSPPPPSPWLFDGIASARGPGHESARDSARNRAREQAAAAENGPRTARGDRPLEVTAPDVAVVENRDERVCTSSVAVMENRDEHIRTTSVEGRSSVASIAESIRTTSVEGRSSIASIAENEHRHSELFGRNSSTGFCLMQQESSRVAGVASHAGAASRAGASHAGASSQNMRKMTFKKKKQLIGHGRITEKGAFAQAANQAYAKPESQGFPGQETLVAVVIMANALVMGISADIHWPKGWEVLEYVFTAFFLFEMLYKMRRIGYKEFFFGREWGWNNFDFIVVFVAVIDLTFSIVIKVAQAGDSVDLSKFTAVKMARLGRLARLVRLLRFKMFKELKLMIQGVFAGLRALIWAIILFFFILSLVAILVRNVYTDEQWLHVQEPFGSVPWAMFTLFRCFTDGCAAHDGTPLIVHFYKRYGAYFMISYCLVFLFVVFGLFNLITAIFLDEVLESTRQRKMGQREKSYSLQEQRLRQAVVQGIKRGAKAMKIMARQKSGVSRSSKRASRLEAAVKKYRPLSRMLKSAPRCKRWLVKLELFLKRLGCCTKTTEIEISSSDEEDEEYLLFLARDSEGGLIIERDLFNVVIEDPAVDDMLEQLDISTSNRWELFDVLDSDMSGFLDLEELIVGLMSMRGPIEKSDVVSAVLSSRELMQIVQSLEDSFASFASHIEAQLAAIGSFLTTGKYTTPAYISHVDSCVPEYGIPLSQGLLSAANSNASQASRAEPPDRSSVISQR